MAPAVGLSEGPEPRAPERGCSGSETAPPWFAGPTNAEASAVSQFQYALKLRLRGGGSCLPRLAAVEGVGYATLESRDGRVMRSKEQAADPEFCELLQSALKRPQKRSKQFAPVIDYLLIKSLGEDRPALQRLLSYLRQAINDLPPRDARFIMSMSQIVGVYNVTPTQAKWLLDIYRRVRQAEPD